MSVHGHIRNPNIFASEGKIRMRDREKVVEKPHVVRGEKGEYGRHWRTA